jgi:hypothetical protein
MKRWIPYGIKASQCVCKNQSKCKFEMDNFVNKYRSNICDFTNNEIFQKFFISSSDHENASTNECPFGALAELIDNSK